MNQIAKKENNLVALLERDGTRAEFAKVAPQFLDPVKLARVAVTQVRRTPKLAACDAGSFLSAMMDCAATGLVPDGRYAHLVPYGSECQFIPDWKGLVMLGMRSDNVRRWRADVVRENDTFDHDRGRIQKHTWDVRKDRGPVVAYYSEVVYKDGEEDFELITLAEANGVKSRSAAGSSGPWKTDFDEMGKKTAVKRHSKRLGHLMTSEFEIAIDRDRDAFPEIDVTQDVEVEEATATLRAGQQEPQKPKGRPKGSKNKPKSVEPDYEDEDQIPGAESPEVIAEPAPVTARTENEDKIEKALVKKGAMGSDTFLDAWGLTRMNWRQANDETVEEIAGACG